MPVLLLLLATLLPAADPVDLMVFIGHGSGVLLPGGRILTNHHVAEDVATPWAPTCTVRLADGRERPARLLGDDPVGDLALLALEDGAGLPGVELAPASALVPGVPVIAVGNPFALGDFDDRPTVTHGVLSTGLVARGAYPLAVLSDAPVNPGNSGGALLLADGRLAGINGQIRTRTGFAANSGIAIAIAAPQLIEVLPALAAAGGGTIARATLTEEVRDGDDGPVDAQGVRIRAVDGSPVVSAAAVRAAVRARVWRSDLRVVLTTATGDRPAVIARGNLPGQPWLGVNLEDRGGRVVVVDVDRPGPASAMGLSAGATLLTIEGTSIRRRLDVLRVMAARGVGERLSVSWRTPQGAEGRGTLEVGWR